MAAVVAPTKALSLQCALELKDLHRSGALYNSLPDDCDQPPVEDDIIKSLATIFVRHNAQRVFGLHLIHGHFHVPKNTVLVGTTFREFGLRWAKPVPIDSLAHTAVHGHVFVFDGTSLCPYELEEGPLPDLTGVGEGFLAELTSYLIKHNLTGLLGLQVLGCGDSSMSELILDQGTVMIESSLAKNVQPTRITGWKFGSVDGQPRVCAANETHCRLQSGNHKVYNVGSPLPKLENVEDLRGALVAVGILQPYPGSDA